MAGRKSARAAAAGPAKAALTTVANQPSFKTKKKTTPIKREPNPDQQSRIVTLAQEVAATSSSSVRPRRQSKGKGRAATPVDEEDAASQAPRPDDDIRALLLNMQASQDARWHAIVQRLSTLEQTLTTKSDATTRELASVRDTVGEMKDTVDEMKETVDEMKETVDEMKETVDETKETIDQDINAELREVIISIHQTVNDDVPDIKDIMFQVTETVQDVQDRVVEFRHHGDVMAEEVLQRVSAVDHRCARLEQNLPTADAVAHLTVHKLGKRMTGQF